MASQRCRRRPFHISAYYLCVWGKYCSVSPRRRYHYHSRNKHQNLLLSPQLLLRKTRKMNKVISTDPHCFISLIGPSGSGKTVLIQQMLTHQPDIFYPKFDRIVYFYQHYQPVYSKRKLTEIHHRKKKSNSFKVSTGNLSINFQHRMTLQQTLFAP